MTASTLAAFVATALLLLTTCEQAPNEPPPDTVQRVMEGIKAGYNAEDKEKFCADFADIMFTEGFTEDAYLDVIRELKHK